MYCKKCGKNNNEENIYCLNCGNKIQKEEEKNTDEFSFGLSILGLLYPLAGIILFIIYIKKKKKKAKGILIFTLIGLTVKVLTVLITILIIKTSMYDSDRAIIDENYNDYYNDYYNDKEYNDDELYKF